MKITKVALIVASVMAALTSAFHIYLIVGSESRLSEMMIGWKEEDLDKMHAVQRQITLVRHYEYWGLVYASWYLILACLLIFIVYRIRKLN